MRCVHLSHSLPVKRGFALFLTHLNPRFLAMSEASDSDENDPVHGQAAEPDASIDADDRSTERDLIAELGEEVEPELEEEDVPDEVRSEVAVGATESGIATNNSLRALSRAARSFLLYEPRNKAIRDFLQDYRENMLATLAAHGSMSLDIRPFEMTRDGEVVYLERDRERSLAFRLFRDGVRRITIEPGVVWEELLRLLEILSIRYTGIRQSEDDIVTLLWKAGFKSIGIVAVEGFVPEEERPEGSLADQIPVSSSGKKRKRKKRRSGIVHVEAPNDFDHPLPNHEKKREPQWVDLDEGQLKDLAAEADSLHLPATSVRLIGRLLGVVADPLDPTDLSDISPLVNEIRDFLLSEGQLEYLTELVRVVEAHRSIDEEKMDAQLARFADTRALRRILQSVSKGSEAVPPELIELLEMVPSDHLEHLMDLLVEERGAASRRLTRMLIERFVRETWDPGFVYERMHSESPGVLCDILRATSRALPDKTLGEAVQLSAHESLEVQMEVLWVLGRADEENLVETTFLQMMSSPHLEVRIRVLDYFKDYGSERVFEPTAELVKRLSTRGISDRECQAAGSVLALVKPDEAKSMLKAWIKPPGVFKRWVEMPGAQALQRTAIYGLAEIAGDDVDKVLRWLSERCSEDVYQLCMKTLVQRRKEGLGRA